MSAPVFVDTNIFIYARSADATKRERARTVLLEIARSRPLVVSAQVLGEVAVNVERLLGRSAALAEVDRLRAAAMLQPLDAETMETTMRIRKRYGLSHWDSQVVAAAAVAGCRWLLTEDLQDNQTIEGVTIANPFAEGFDPASL